MLQGARGLDRVPAQRISGLDRASIAVIFESLPASTTTSIMASAFLDLLFTVSDLPPLIFGWLDLSSLALAACVCRKWRDTARRVRGTKDQRFRLVLAELVADAPLLAWAVANLNEKQ